MTNSEKIPFDVRARAAVQARDAASLQRARCATFRLLLVLFDNKPMDAVSAFGAYFKDKRNAKALREEIERFRAFGEPLKNSTAYVGDASAQNQGF